MKLLLTSGGVTNETILAGLVDMLGKPVDQCHALCIPTAQWGHPMCGPQSARGFATRSTSTLPVLPIGTGSGRVDAAPATATIDFEDGLDPGDIVSELDVGLGIRGVDAGIVSVYGERVDLPGVNQAMVFDAECGGAAASCSGDDADLFQPQLGNVLIISESGDSSDPDDADVGERIDIDFSEWGTGSVTVRSLDVLDVEADESPGRIEIGETIVPIPDIGDGNVSTVEVGGTGSVLAVVLNGSGAIDNIQIEYEPQAPTTTTTTTSSTTTSTITSTTSSTSTTTTAGR